MVVASDDSRTGTMEIPEGQGAGVLWLEVGDRRVHRSYAVAEGTRLIVGSSRRCDIVLEDRTVSSRHCEIGNENGLLWVQDLDSKNGLYAGGARVKGAQLTMGSYFTIGCVPLCVRTNQGPVGEQEPLPGVIGTSAPMMRVASEVRGLAQLSVPVLIRGATGTGKELIAAAIHTLSRRSLGPFCPLNMGAVPASLAVAELFGHDRGAFTGAGQARKGAFVTAHGGTLFLDEIGETSMEVQVLLLRALEQREVHPLGFDGRVAVDVRVVAATCAPLEEAVAMRRFREDLLHRLAVGTIQLPPLAERKSDIGVLVEHMLVKHSGEVGEKKMTPAGLGRLMTHDWPGNVRELSNVVLRSASKTKDIWIHARDVDEALRQHRHSIVPMSQDMALALVKNCNGKVATAAKQCGVPRSTFRGWLNGRRRKGSY